MKIIITTIICVLNMHFIFDSLGSSEKSNEVSAMLNLKSIIEQYYNKTNEIPTSWEEMISKGFLGDTTLNKSRLYLDFETRYRFPDSTRPIIIGNRNEKIVVMAIQSGLEGDEPDASHVEDRAGRWLILSMPTGGFETRKYSEAFLKDMFKNSGFDLRDYTGPNGKWSPNNRISDLKQQLRSSNEGIGRKTNQGIGRKTNHGERQSLPNISDYKSKQSNSVKLQRRPWIFWLIGGLGTAAMIGIIILVMRKRRHTPRDVETR